jgi:hypothetical protein
MKTVPGPSHGGTDEGEGKATSGSENETCLVAARPSGREPGGLLHRRRLPGVVSAAVQALRRLTATTLSRNLSLMVKEWGLKGWNQATPTDPDVGGGEQHGWQLAGQGGARIVPRQRRGRNMQGF